MTVTVQSFRVAFPVFNDPAKFSDPEIQFWLNFAALRHNAARWLDMLDFGYQLFVAHNLSLQYNAREAQKAGQGAGTIQGVLTSVSAKGVSWTREAPPTNPNDSHWGLTIYGTQWRELARMMGAGGLQIGVPSPEDMRNTGAWQGPNVGFF